MLSSCSCQNCMCDSIVIKVLQFIEVDIEINKL